MTVNKYALALPIVTAHVLTDNQDDFVVGARQVFPAPIKRCNAVPLQVLRVVREAYFCDNAIAAECMLTRLLQVHYHPNLQTAQKRKTIH